MGRRLLGYIGLIVAYLAAWPYGIDHIPVWLVLTSHVAYVLIVVLFSQPKRWHLTRYVKYGGLIASVTVVVMWLVSAVVYLRLPYAASRAVAIGSGSYIHHKGVSIDGTPLTFTAVLLPTTRPLGEWGSSRADWGRGKVAFSSFIPIWPSALALALPTAVLWLLLPKTYPKGHCQQCGYDLTGNESGICPECGKDIERP